MEQQWYIARDKQKIGPYSIEQMRALVTNGKLFKSDMVLESSQKKWRLAETVEEVFSPSKDNNLVNITPEPSITPIIPFSKNQPNEQWFIARNKQKIGPFSTAQMQQKATIGELLRNEMVLDSNQKKWCLAETVEDIFPSVKKDVAPTQPLLLTLKSPSFLSRYPVLIGTLIVLVLLGCGFFFSLNKQNPHVSVDTEIVVAEKSEGPRSPVVMQEQSSPKEEPAKSEEPKSPVVKQEQSSPKEEPAKSEEPKSSVVKREQSSPKEEPVKPEEPKSPVVKQGPEARPIDDGKPESEGKIESLLEAVRQAGFTREPSIFDIKDFLKFGSASLAKKFKNGDNFDKIEANKEAANYRDSLRKRNFYLNNLKFKVVGSNDIENKGLRVIIPLPFRAFKEEKEQTSGLLSERPGSSDIRSDALGWAFLTKTDKLQRCQNFIEVDEVRRQNGVLYVAEADTSTLYLVLKGEFDALKQIARNSNDYSVRIEFGGMLYTRPETWGYYKEAALKEENWDCQVLRERWPPLLEDKQPDYFVTHSSGLKDGEKIPEILMATLMSLSVSNDKKKEIIGGFNQSKDITEPIAKPPTPAIKLDLTKIAEAIEKEMVLIPAGKFKMGSPASEKGRDNCETQHEVTLTKPFYMGKHEVTQEQWQAVMGNNPSSTKGAKLPVTQVSWTDCQEFIKKLNEKTSGGYRLPTEAEWEYTCRAGTTTAYSFGDSLSKSDASIGGESIKNVGSYNPNAFGLYDMHGNVHEWCNDWTAGYPAGAATDPKGPATGEYHILRGGSFVSPESSARSSFRTFYLSPTDRGYFYGFRLARTADIKATVAEPTAPIPGSTELTPVTKGLLVAPFNEAKAKEAQKEVAKSLKKEVEEKVDLGKGVNLEMLLIPSGKFKMGSPSSEKDRFDDETQHEVTLTNPFYMGKYEVTQDQWEVVMGKNPSNTKEAKLPVTDVSWEDCKEFIKKLNEKTTGGYRLPTEAEWEFACRAGTTTAYSFGDGLSKSDANINGGSTKAVGSYKPNAFGLYDMHGNVWEWCEDYGKADYPAREVTGERHEMRGGSFYLDVSHARSSAKYTGKATDRDKFIGLRLVRSP